MNRVWLTGRTTKDIELRYTIGGTPIAVTRFTLAVDRRKTKDGNQEADFVNCQAWGKTAELLEKYVHKGNKIGVLAIIFKVRVYVAKPGKSI